ncbi:MAG: phosphoadenosine phosphosulfate reductase family protein [Methanoregula sp.]|jgi:phosphoadenosine phosphosulfate reductase
MASLPKKLQNNFRKALTFVILLFIVGAMSLLEQDLIRGAVDKVQIAFNRIKEFEPEEGYYVAFSGGKDSVVILDLVKRSGVKFDAHYNITGVDPPELVRFIRDEFPDVERHRPEITMWQLIVKKMMPPTRLVRYCCEYLKERGGKGRKVITGVRWAESNKRKTRQVVETCFKSSHKFYVNPIIDWTDSDVWEYIHSTGIKYCHLYDEGFKRLGCIGCPMAGKNRLKEFARWPRYEALYRKAFDKAAIANNLKFGDQYERKGGVHLRWTDGDAMFKWWMEEKHKKVLPDQSVMFE